MFYKDCRLRTFLLLDVYCHISNMSLYCVGHEKRCQNYSLSNILKQHKELNAYLPRIRYIYALKPVFFCIMYNIKQLIKQKRNSCFLINFTYLINRNQIMLITKITINNQNGGDQHQQIINVIKLFCRDSWEHTYLM